MPAVLQPTTAKPDSGTKAVTTLQDVFEQWLEKPHDSNAKAAQGLKNSDRGVTSIKSYERALRLVALATTERSDGLEHCPAEALDVNAAVLERRVVQGAELLAQREKKATPAQKTLQNAISYCKGIQRAVYGTRRQKSTRQRIMDLPKRRTRTAFSFNSWPEGLKKEWAAFSDWKCRRHLPEAERPFRKQACRPGTIEDKRRQLNVYIGYLVRECGMTEVTLEMVCDPDIFREFLNSYFEQDADGGYWGAANNTTTCALIAQYLAAKQPERRPTGGARPLWDIFYDLGREIKQDGAERGELKTPESVGNWKPIDLRILGREAWDMPMQQAVKRENGIRFEQQFFNRRRTALFFFLAYETPLRHRNWIEMRWHKNLTRTATGLWEVHFEGQELKIGRRKERTNVYHRVYSEEASQLIDAWYDMVTARFGEGFEASYPYVFTAWQKEGKLKDNRLAKNTFHYHVNHLVMELRGEPFNPHKIRHIVASYLVNEFGPKGLGLAAELLGDTVQVILQTYYRPNNEEAMRLYLEKV